MVTVIGIPIESDNGLDSKVTNHFGKAPYYFLAEGDSFRVIKNTSNHFGGKEHPPVVLKNAGVNVVLAGRMGDHARQIFDKFGIKVYYGVKDTVKDTLELFKNGKLSDSPLETDGEHHHHHHDH